jgi:putative transcriptional regulator
MRVTKVAMPDVKAIRELLHMSQHHFAAAYRIPLSTLKNWEQGRCYRDAPAAAYLLAIQRRAKEVMEAVARMTRWARRSCYIHWEMTDPAGLSDGTWQRGSGSKGRDPPAQKPTRREPRRGEKFSAAEAAG